MAAGVTEKEAPGQDGIKSYFTFSQLQIKYSDPLIS